MRRQDTLFVISMLLPLFILSAYFILLIGSQSAFFTVGNFIAQISSSDIQSAVGLSLTAATLSSAVALIFALPAAYSLARFNFPGKRLIDTLIDLPMVLTPIALGTLILMTWNTAIGHFLSELGLTLPFTLAGAVLAQFTVVVAISIRMLKATFEQIDPRQEQIARLLGCSAFSGFFYVTLPLAKRGIVAAMILTWARAIGEFGATVMVVGTGGTSTLPSSIYLAMSMADLPRTVVLVLILIVISLIVLLGVRSILEPRT